MKTTADYRSKALEHEKNMGWAKAAKCWEMAIQAYPSHIGSALAEFDIKRMTARMGDCRWAAARKKREKGRM